MRARAFSRPASSVGSLPKAFAFVCAEVLILLPALALLLLLPPVGGLARARASDWPAGLGPSPDWSWEWNSSANPKRDGRRRRRRRAHLLAFRSCPSDRQASLSTLSLGSAIDART